MPDDEVWSRIGTPLHQMFAPFLPPESVPQAIARYRALYPTTGVHGVRLLPGAAESVTAVRALGGCVVVVSAKIETAVHLVLDEVGLDVDVVVGDHVGDVVLSSLTELPDWLHEHSRRTHGQGN